MKTVIELNQLYPYPKPFPSAQIFLLGLIVISGLIALFFAAFHAFRLVAEPAQAFFAALVIEAGLIAECLAIINKPKSVPPWLGLIISYVVSGTYNYTQAAQAGEGLGGWELIALAFGPLSALAVVSLAFGSELRGYQEQVEIWNKNRAAWVESERQRLETVAREREQARFEAEQKHAEKMARIETSKNRPNQQIGSGQKSISKDEAISLIMQFLADNPGASLSQIGRQIGRPKSTTGNYVNELIVAGKLHKNGDGWKVPL